MTQAVSVVIPTIGHVGLFRAVASALGQTVAIEEILVVADTVAELNLPRDKRVRVLRVGPGAGGNVARQAGIDQAKGDLIALLDDDDEWLPHRLGLQLEAVKLGGMPLVQPWIATSRVTRVSGGARSVLPSKALQDGGDLPRYLFLKPTPWSGHGFIQASTLLFPARIAREVPFDPAVKFHQDINWILEVSERFRDLRVIQVWEALVIYNSGAGSVSKRIDPFASIEWARSRLAGRSKRVLGDFILTQSLGFARRAGAKPMVKVLISGLRHGRPGASAVVYAALSIAKEAIGASLRSRTRDGEPEASA
jgi:glycosyltransferase involved in cell wall biosynthesis